MLSAVALLSVGSLGLLASQVGATMNLALLKDKDAVCLDGTQGGYYYGKSQLENSTSWQLFFQGGGWCYDEKDCFTRSQGNLGSSKGWGPTSEAQGTMSTDCSTNPAFCNFHRAHFNYCDGNSFSGNRDEPIMYNGNPIYFRGKKIIDATLEALLPLGLKDATEVVLSGCSAGGLATFLHADYVHSWLKQNVPSLKKYGAVPVSGFFLNHKTVEGKPVYGTEIANIFKLSNASSGLNQKCIASYDSSNQYLCNFAENSYAHTESRIFPINSALDSWQTGCIYTSELPDGFPNQQGNENGVCNAVPDYADCGKNPEQCDQSQIKVMNRYIDDFMQTISSKATFSQPGNGGFFHSCHTHCEASSTQLYNQFAIGGVTIQEMVNAWWKSDGTEPSSKFTTSPCTYKEGASGPRVCNPTCLSR